MPTPILLKRDDLGLGVSTGFVARTATSMAVSADARRVYLGQHSSYDRHRLNLGVLTVDQNDLPGREPRMYADSTDPLNLGTASTVCMILPTTRYPKLYLAVQTTDDARRATDRSLTVYDLDHQGEPLGEPRTYPTRLPYLNLESLALHPTSNQLYMAGGGSGVAVYLLDTTGEPQGEPVFYGFGGEAQKKDLAISPSGERMYLGGTWSPATSRYEPALELVNLDASGIPVASTFRWFPAESLSGEAYLRFHYTPRAIYRRQYPPLAPGHIPPPSRPLSIWPLRDTTGDPEGPSPQLLPGLQPTILTVDPVRDRLWLGVTQTFPDAIRPGHPEAVSGTMPVSFSVDSRGFPVPPIERYPSSARQIGQLAAVAANGTPLFLTMATDASQIGSHVRDYRLRLTLDDLSFNPDPTPSTFTVYIYTFRGNAAHFRYPAEWSSLALNVPSPWLRLDRYFDVDDGSSGPYLQNRFDQVPFFICLFYTPAETRLVERFRVSVDVAEIPEGVDGDTSLSELRILKSLTETVQGSAVGLLLPGYAYEPADSESRAEAIELFSQHTRNYLRAAAHVAVAECDRPRQFIVSCEHMLGYQGHLGHLQAEAEAMSLLGFNAVNAYMWSGIPAGPQLWGALPPSLINATLNGYGLMRRSWAASGPPLQPDVPTNYIFDFALDRAGLGAWAAWHARELFAANGSTPSTLGNFMLFDEPGWRYPDVLAEVMRRPEWLDAFHSYLEGKGFQPADFGQTDWSLVLPTGRRADMHPSTETNQPLRRLFYWTMRFFPESASRAMSICRTALMAAYGQAVSVAVNWNGWVNVWYEPLAHRDGAPPADLGSFDWLESGRQSALTLWTEDQFADNDPWNLLDAETWSFFAAVLRSAAMLGDRGFGAYVKGSYLGGHPEGASYRMLSLIGHGAKMLHVYMFGPTLVNSDGWGEQTEVYKPLADALRLVGRAEDLLYPGVPARGKVAVLLPSASRLWDVGVPPPVEAVPPLYGNAVNGDIRPLYYALTHAGYSVDFVDDADLATDEWTSRGYTTLYLTGPNLMGLAQEKVAYWVKYGGMLVVTPGAAVADEYNSPTTTLDPILGLGSRASVRDSSISSLQTDTLRVNDPRFGSGRMPLVGPIARLTSAGATTVATLESGEAGITMNAYNNGRAIAYAFFPGFQYGLTADRTHRRRLPRSWGKMQRDIAVAPVRLAATPRPVQTDHEGVEVCRLESDYGIALVLLNWTDAPIHCLTIGVPRVGPYIRVTSAQGAPVFIADTGPSDVLTLTVSLEHVDVLRLRRPPRRADDDRRPEP